MTDKPVTTLEELEKRVSVLEKLVAELNTRTLGQVLIGGVLSSPCVPNIGGAYIPDGRKA